MSRQAIAADKTYFVRSNGSNSNNGAKNTPWLTLQHAVDYVSASVDGCGFSVHVDIGPGTFVGFAVKPMLGLQSLIFSGAGSSQTTISNGPNDGVYNAGECIDLYSHVGCPVAVNRVTFFNSVVDIDSIAIYNPGQQVYIGDVIAWGNTDVVFTGPPQNLNHGSLTCYAQSAIFLLPGTLTFARAGMQLNAEFRLYDGAICVTNGASINVTGAPIYDAGLILLHGGTFSDTNGGVSFSGAFTGKTYNIKFGSALYTSGVMPAGSLPGTADASSSVDGVMGTA